MNENDENDMYEFLVKNKYIQTNIDENIYYYPLKLTSNIKHTEYKNKYFINFFKTLFPGDFPFSYLKDLNKEELKLDIKTIENQSQNTNLKVEDLEIKKLVFIFCIVFFPLTNFMKTNPTRLKLKYYPKKIVASSSLNRDNNYIELYKEFIGKKYEFIDVYIDWVTCNKLKNFACYTYLHFLLNMVEADIEFYKNIIENNEYYENNENTERDLNDIKNNITLIISRNKEKKIDTDGPTYSALYKKTDEEFIKFLNSSKIDLLDNNYQYKSGYKNRIEEENKSLVEGGKKSRKRKHNKLKKKRKSTRKKRRKSNKKHR